MLDIIANSLLIAARMEQGYSPASPELAERKARDRYFWQGRRWRAPYRDDRI